MNQMEILELKYATTEIKNLLGKLGPGDEKSNESEDRAMETL